jgi:pimeloyl-ACP methyl ester carboxylesterase
VVSFRAGSHDRTVDAYDRNGGHQMNDGPSHDDRYRTVDVPVRGGTMRVGVWEPVASAPAARDLAAPASAVPTLLAVHGITASHRCWPLLAQALPQWRVIAPDLRGRGRSNGLPGPYGMANHADDLVAVLDHLEVPAAVVVGHSMGGYVTVALHHWHPHRASSLVLVDGGVPLPRAEGLTDEEFVDAVLGPVRARLAMRFDSREAYQQLFRAHPAFATSWSEAVADYADYDLVGEPPNLHASTTEEAFVGDSIEQQDVHWLTPALHELPPGTPFLRAPRDLIDREPGLFPPAWLERCGEQFPAVDVREVPDVNHYTIVLSDAGAAAIAAVVQATR